MRWLSAIALILYLSLLVTPQVSSVHARYFSPLADSQIQAIEPLTGQSSLLSEQESSDDNDNSLLLAADKLPLYLNPTLSILPASVALLQLKAAHPVRAPPLTSTI
ncbi:hypothetical protein [Arsukibacterium ikkense]|uniref:hypothetical protein n=1 Tax=Arsukibacterium ikkense TaxID=336831 RepID=UPI00069A5257|nr:hypothetical protein [Arsukibacterium ikkense]